MFLTVHPGKMDGSSKRSKVHTMLQRFEPPAPTKPPLTSAKPGSPVVAGVKGNHDDKQQSVSSHLDGRTTPTKAAATFTYHNEDNAPEVQERVQLNHNNKSADAQEKVQNLRKLFQGGSIAQDESTKPLTPVPPLRRHRPKLPKPGDGPKVGGDKAPTEGGRRNDKNGVHDPRLRKGFSGGRGREADDDALTTTGSGKTKGDAMLHMGMMADEKVDKPLPLGPPPAKPPRTFEHDVYVARKQESTTRTGDDVDSKALPLNAKRKTCFPSVSWSETSRRSVPSPPDDIPFLDPSSLHRFETVAPYAVTRIADITVPKPDASPNSLLPKTRSRFFVAVDDVPTFSPMKRCFSDDHIYEEVAKPCFGQPVLQRTLSADSEEMFVDNIQYDTITCHEPSVLENQKYHSVLESLRSHHGRFTREPYSVHTRSYSDSNQKKLAAHFSQARTIYKKRANKRQVSSLVRDIIAQSFAQVNNGSIDQSVKHSNDNPIIDEDSGDSDNELTASEVQERIKYCRTISRAPSVKHDIFKQSSQLFNYVLIVGLQSCTEKNGELQPYIKLSYPVMVENHFKQWVPHVCFPGAEFWKPSPSGETYMSVFTDETGKRTFGYCRRIKPDGCTISLPVVICVISPVMDFSFFSQFLGELEKGYGSPVADLKSCLETFRKKKLPKPGGELTLVNQITSTTVTLRRSEDPTEDCYGMDTLLAALGFTNLIKVFASLLLERKVLLHCDSVSKLSQCVQALYSLLYPFEWDHPYVPVLPGCVIDVLGSPTPFLIGLLNDHVASLGDTLVEDVLMVNLENDVVIHEQGDELKVIPKRLQKALLRALKSAKSLPEPSKSVTVSEAFLRMFVEAVGSYGNYVVVQQDGKKIFEKEPFCTFSTSRSINTFLQWFTETQLFYTFIDSKLHGSSVQSLFEKRVVEYKEELENMPHTFRENVKELGKRMKNMFGGFRSPVPKTIDKG